MIKNNKLKIIGAFVVFVGFFIFLVDGARAQFIVPVSISAPVTLTIQPENPKQNENVSVLLESNSVDIKRSHVDWYLNDRLIKSGLGIASVSVNSGNIGERQKVSVVIRPDTATKILKEVSIIPTNISLVWEGGTYTPPFYRGRSLPSPGSEIIAEAFVSFKDSNGEYINNKNIVYTWKINGRVLQKISGTGKSSVKIAVPNFSQRMVVSVDAVSVDNVFKNSETVLIPISSPRIVLYEDDPLIGVYLQKAIRGVFEIFNEETTFIAIPYFFSIQNPSTAKIKYLWNVNDKTLITDVLDPSRIVLRFTNEARRANVSLSIENIESFLQYAEGAWNIFLSENTQAKKDPFFKQSN